MVPDAPETLSCLGQSLWLDNINGDVLDTETRQHYSDTLSVSGLTANPTIFDQAILRSTSYDAEIQRQLDAGRSGEALFFHLAVQDLTWASEPFAEFHARTVRIDDFVAHEPSPCLSYDT